MGLFIHHRVAPRTTRLLPWLCPSTAGTARPQSQFSAAWKSGTFQNRNTHELFPSPAWAEQLKRNQPRAEASPWDPIHHPNTIQLLGILVGSTKLLPPWVNMRKLVLFIQLQSPWGNRFSRQPKIHLSHLENWLVWCFFLFYLQSRGFFPTVIQKQVPSGHTECPILLCQGRHFSSCWNLPEPTSSHRWQRKRDFFPPKILLRMQTQTGQAGATAQEVVFCSRAIGAYGCWFPKPRNWTH